MGKRKMFFIIPGIFVVAAGIGGLLLGLRKKAEGQRGCAASLDVSE